MPAALSKQADEEAAHKARQDRFFKGVAVSWFAAVIAHTLNLQAEAILVRDACGGDLARAASLAANCQAAAGLLGLAVNQVGGRLSDTFGRKLFYAIGPLAQAIAGFMVFARPRSIPILVISKVLRAVFTTFSGTVMGTAGLRDMFEGAEYGKKASQAGSIVGLGIMVGPLVEGMILKRFKVGGERLSYLALSLLGMISFSVTGLLIPETLDVCKRAKFDAGEVLASANPFGFTKLFATGSFDLKLLATITCLQTMIDGKNMSDMSQIWMREHLKLSVEGIRNFVMGFGFLSLVSGAKLTPALLTRLSAWWFTTATNLTNFVAFALRGAAEKSWLYFGMMPLMLPGANGGAIGALVPVMNAHMNACGFGAGESSAWLNNLRVLLGVVATFTYGNFYAWCRRNGVYPGHTYVLAALLGAALPQALMMASFKEEDLSLEKIKTQDGRGKEQPMAQ